MWMEYNPFHPMSVHNLREFEWSEDEKVVNGKYVYKDTERKFSFSLRSKCYRIHSHVWLQKVRGYRYDASLENYDLCANFDFVKELAMTFEEKKTFLEPLVVEPVIYKPIKSRNDINDLDGLLVSNIPPYVQDEDIKVFFFSGEI